MYRAAADNMYIARGSRLGRIRTCCDVRL